MSAKVRRLRHNVAALALIIPFAAQAQQAAEPPIEAPQINPDESRDIVVTAQRREQRLQDVPVSVSVITGDALDNAALRSLEDVSARLPNIRISTGSIVNNIIIRGVGSGNNAGFEQSVATFVDGVYRSRSRSTRAALFDVAQIEVLKGPQTTFFGANVIAGAINITTRRPGSDFEYNGTAMYMPGTGEYNLEAGVSAPLGEDLAMRVALRASGMDGYIHNVNTGEDGPRDRSLQGRVALEWQPSGTIQTDLRFDIGRSRTRNALALELVGCPPDPPIVQAPLSSCQRYLAANGGLVDDELDFRTANLPTYTNYDFFEVALTNRVELGTGSLVATTGYFEHDFSAQAQVIPFPYSGTVRGYAGQPTFQTEDYRQFSQELRYQSAAGDTLEYMVGGYFSADRLDYLNLVGFFFAPFGAFNPSGTTDAMTPTTGIIGQDQESTALSAFASATIRLTEQLRMNFGARYSHISKEARRTYELGTADGNVTPGSFVRFDPATETTINAILGSELGDFAEPERKDARFMPSAGLQYDLTSDIMAYVSYSRGFKAGGYAASAAPNSFGPETVDAYEAGVKAQLLDRRLTLNAAFYRSDYRDLQESNLITLPSGAVTTLIRNVAQSRSQGVEASFNFRASPNLVLFADAAYLDATYTSYPDGACTILQSFATPNCRQDLTGSRRSFAPEWSGNVGATITLPAGDRFRFRAEPLYYFSSSYFQSSAADPLLEQDAFGKLDLRLGFGPDDESWEVALIARNLTDEITAGFRQAVTGAPGSIGALTDPPRTFGFQLSIRK